MRHECRVAAAAACLLLFAATWAGAQEPAYRFRAPITVTQPAAFVRLPLPATAYGYSEAAGLRDLRVVDAKGERVPFAVLAPRAPKAQSTEDERAAVLYPLKARPAGNTQWSAPIDVVLQGDRITVKRRAAPAQGKADGGPAGWLFDLGERKPAEPRPQSLRIQWSGPAEFAATFRFDTSDELRDWRAGGAGQLLALASASGPLSQPNIMLPSNAGRFVRLYWGEPTAAPVVTGASVVAARETSVELDKPTELVLGASPMPIDKGTPDPQATRALHFDLGGILPLEQVDLRLAAGTRVAPVRLQGRERGEGAWRELGASVFYRLERGSEVSVSSPLALQGQVRYLRVLPDERSAALDPAQTQLVVLTGLASLVFASQGTAPYTLLAGSAQAAASALPMASLVADLEAERARFGSATLGAWAEEASVAQAAEQKRQLAAMRPWLLWALLLAGVAGLAGMVWRLARAGKPAAVGAPPDGQATGAHR